MARHAVGWYAVVLAIGGMTLLPARGLAQGGNPMSAIPIYGSIAAGTFLGPNGTNPIGVTRGTFAGFFSVGSFSVLTNQLRAVGTVSGTLALVDALGNPLPLQQVSQGNVALPVAIGAGASCQRLHLLLGPAGIMLFGVVMRLGQAALDFRPQSAPGNALAAPLCSLAGVLGGKNPSMTAVATRLQQILQALSRVSPLQNIPVVGVTASGGLIPGTFSIASFAADPGSSTGLAAAGSFSGIAPNAAGQPTPGTQPLSLPLTVDASSTCQLLLLTFSSLSQNLLGTAAAINPLVLNITAQQVPITLLCGIATQSATGDATTLAGQLNEIAAALQSGTTAPAAGAGSKTLPVSLTASDGERFAGTLTLTRFTTQINRLFVDGTLIGTLTRPTGANGGRITQPVARIPVVPGAATCQNLTLALGPLDLSLVGLAVSLDPMTLNVAAPANTGTARGNLLCQIANLLDQQPADLNTLTLRLNQLLNTLP